jgi:hypothetical protein
MPDSTSWRTVLFGVELRLLRQVADRQVRHRRGFADDVLVDAGHDAQHGRLARAVQAEQADLGAGEEAEREMSLRIWRFGGTILPTRFMVKTYWAMVLFFG